MIDILDSRWSGPLVPIVAVNTAIANTQKDHESVAEKCKKIYDLKCKNFFA